MDHMDENRIPVKDAPENEHPVPPAPKAHPAAHANKSSSGSKTFLFGFLGAALACVIAFFGLGLYSNLGIIEGGTTLGTEVATQIIADEEGETLAELVADKALPSIVAVDVYTTSTPQLDLFGRNTNPDTGELVQSSLGSGVVLSEDGYIITNYHVIEGAERLSVTVEGEQYEAEVVGTDPSSDIAVIKAVGTNNLTPIEIGTSSDLKTGQWVMTLGSPFGYEQSVATGIVSAVSRSQIVESGNGSSASVYVNMIQTDAAINPGNSGGALVDSNGRLIGINTLIASGSASYSGVGFAIPIDYAIVIAQQIIDGITPTHSQLGVSLASVTSDLAERYDLDINEGAYVTQVYEGSGAAEANIEAGDIITKFGDETIESASDLMIAVRTHNPGDRVTVEFNREGRTETVEVTLGSDATS